MDIQYAPVVSPTLLTEMGGLEHPKDLARFPISDQYEGTDWKE